MRTALGAALLALLASASSPALADDEAPLESFDALRDACRAAGAPGRRALHVVELRRFRFEGYDPGEGFLLVDTRRNLRLFGGSVELFPSGLEAIGFVASAERARELQEAQRAGARLRIGFFLGFDGDGQPCLVRSAMGVTLVRADLAFAELVDPDGRVLAREDSERLTAWRDAAEREAIPGEGPRAAVGAPFGEDASVPEPWQRHLASAGLRERLGACHVGAVQRGAAGRARMVVRLSVDAEGHVEATAALSSLEDAEATRCVLAAFDALLLEARSARVLRVPVRFAD